jgi:arylsulfatase A-like enzyme
MPALLSWPGRLPARRVVEGLGCTIDILPTFLGIAGASVPAASRVIDGRDILPMALGESPSPHESLFWKYGSQVALRQGRWKLILKGRESFEEDRRLPKFFLADLEADPGETRNLAAEQPRMLRQMVSFARKMERDVETRR